VSIRPLTAACLECAISSLTVGLRVSSGTETRLRKGSMSWFNAGTALCAKITVRAGSMPMAR